MGIEQIEVFGDSKSIINQILGNMISRKKTSSHIVNMQKGYEQGSMPSHWNMCQEMKTSKRMP